MYVCLHVFLQVCMYGCMDVCMYVCVCFTLCMYVCIPVCVLYVCSSSMRYLKGIVCVYMCVYFSVPGEPRRFGLEVVNSTTVSLHWRPPGKQEQHGVIRGYQISYVSTLE